MNSFLLLPSLVHMYWLMHFLVFHVCILPPHRSCCLAQNRKWGLLFCIYLKKVEKKNCNCFLHWKIHSTHLSKTSQKSINLARSKCRLLLDSWMVCTAQLAMFFSKLTSSHLIWKPQILENISVGLPFHGQPLNCQAWNKNQDWIFEVSIINMNINFYL